MENTNINVNDTVEENNVEGGATEIETTTEKTFTQADIDRIIEKRLARERKDLQAKIEAERQEAEELAKLSEQEKQKKLFEKQVKEFEETKKAFESEKLLNETSRQLSSKNLPVEFAEMLKGVDAEKTFENIKLFEEKFNNSLEKMVNERLKGNAPKTSTKVVPGGITKDDFRKMTMSQRLNLRSENPKLYEELTQ